MSDISTPRRQVSASENTHLDRTPKSASRSPAPDARSEAEATGAGDASSGEGRGEVRSRAAEGEPGDSATGSSKRSGRVRSASGAFRFINNYGLLVCLGEGGMGEVWAARDPSGPKNLVVALKTTKQQGAEAARVLWDEARIASLIEHPNVCRVREMGRDGDLQYLVMDYSDGGTLHDLLERSTGRVLPFALASRILSGVCAGLHAAHELTDEEGHHLGVVHRDVSPQNILLSTSGQVTVTDFGVAKALGQAHKATETGEMKGKLSYMAPEQITSRDIDRRVDVFALGCVLYQITLGRRPFHGEDALATLYQLLEKDLVPPREINPDYPEELEQVVLKALAKDRNARFSTAEEMQRALEHFLLSEGQPLSEADVAEALMSALGDTISARKEEIRRRVRALEVGDVSTEGSLRPSVGPSAEGVDTSGGTVTDPPPQRPSRTTWLAAAGVFLAIGLATMGALRTVGEGDAVRATEVGVSSAGDEARRAAASGNAASPAPPGRDVGASSASPRHPGANPPGSQDPGTNDLKPSVQGPRVGDSASVGSKQGDGIAPQVAVTISVSPPTALIEIDGQQVGTGRYTEEVARSTTGHLLQISAPGHESLTRALVFDRSQVLELTLTPRPATRPSGAPTRPQVPAAPGPTGTTKATKKAPRALDSENPFATP